ncbi:hypothetical protein TNIN_400971 [Trichonephila inaurata madagascariensis]|uniref:Uncharacterized protein n=1 Tax=Trichonephila inaurata madagascariensis TaxID=2747483 RepID=A0A8X7BU53_9ARAC|nr:hypothetical protein TNIN_400971 [Trichonephila inaurata madagascariensis]
MNKAKISPKIVSNLNKNVEIEKISPALPEKSVCILRVKNVLKTPDTIQEKKSLVWKEPAVLSIVKDGLKTPDTIQEKKSLMWKEPAVLSDKDLTNIAVESTRNVKRSAVILSDDSSSSRNISTKEYSFKRQESDKASIKVINISKQKECQDIKLLPNVSNSLKLISEKKTFEASEKIPPVSTKIIYVGNASQIPVIKQAIAASKCAVNSSSEQILHNASKINKDHTLQMKHLSIKKVSSGKQTVQMNPTEVTGTEKIIINLSEGRRILGTEAKSNLMNFSESSSSIQNKKSNDIEENKQMIILPIKSISEVTSHNLELPSLQNSEIELCAIQCNTGRNVSLKSNSPVKIYSPKQISTLNRAVNTQPVKLVNNGSSISCSVNKPTSEDSKFFMPCSISSLEKDIKGSKSTKKTENEYPPVNLSVAHVQSKSCLMYPLKKNSATDIKSNVIKTNNNNSSIQIMSPATNTISSVNQQSKYNLYETENRSPVPKSNSSIKKKTLMPIEVSLTKQGKDNSCKQRNKKSDVEIVSCAAETSSVSSTTICSSNMNEISFGKNNSYKTCSKDEYQLTQQKQFVLANKVANFTSLPKFTPAILLPKVLLERLPDAITEACIKNGYVLIQKHPKISDSSTIEDTDIREKRNKGLKRKRVQYPVLTNPKVQVNTKCDELNDSNEGTSNVHGILNENVKHAAFSEEKNASPLTKKDETPIQSVLPALKKDLRPTNLKIIKISANEMEKLSDCFKNPCAIVPPTTSKQQTLTIPILVNEDAEKKETKTINEPESASMYHKTPMKQVFEKKEDRKSLSSDLLELIESEKQKKVEKDKMKKKEKILKKMLLKYEEKEEKKQWKYLQKRLIRCIEKNKNRLKRRTGLLMEIVTNSSKLKEQIHKLNCTENDDVKHLLSKLVKAIRDKDSIVAISKNHKEVAKSQSIQEEKTVIKDQVQSFGNMSTSKIQRNHKSRVRVGERKKSISKSTSMNIFSSSVSQDNVYCYDPESERSREDTISYSKLNESQEKTSPNEVISYKLRKRNPKKLFADDPFVDLSIITDEKYTIECVCGSRDCNGIHPECLQFP